MKNTAELQMLPDEMLAMPPAVVKVNTGGKTVNSEQEDKMMGEEVVIRLVKDKATTIDKPHSRLLVLTYCHCVKKFITSVKMHGFLKTVSHFSSGIYSPMIKLN